MGLLGTEVQLEAEIKRVSSQEGEQVWMTEFGGGLI